ncbi:MAG: DUF4258 domain-containing protein [Nitrospira sp. LK70]|nr:DUF4258 domain-containing protein [Nitrospira sp. LK70]
MPRQLLARIKAAIKKGAYDMTAHASEEMAEDDLDIVGVETSILKGRLVRSEKDDPRGTRHIVYGIGPDQKALIGTVGRFTETSRYLIITVYRVTET